MRKTEGNDTMDALTFQAEIQRIERLMYRVSRSYLGNDEDAADAVQDALTKAWEKRSHLRDPNQFRAWFMRILTNQCKDALRKRRRMSFYPLEEGSVPVDMQPTRLPVIEAMEALTPEQRTPMLLHYVDGYPVAEIARALGIPEGTVKTRMRSARKRLSKTLLIEWEEQV